jgi:hypothetical protein
MFSAGHHFYAAPMPSGFFIIKSSVGRASPWQQVGCCRWDKEKETKKHNIERKSRGRKA